MSREVALRGFDVHASLVRTYALCGNLWQESASVVRRVFLLRVIELSGLNLANRWKHFRLLLERETRSTRQRVRESSWPYASDVADELKKEGGIPFGLFSLADNKDPSSLFFLGTGCAEPSAFTSRDEADSTPCT